MRPFHAPELEPPMATPLTVAKITQHPDKHEGATVRGQGWVR